MSQTVPSACAHECVTPRPFWKAIAPIIEDIIIPERASMSLGEVTAEAMKTNRSTTLSEMPMKRKNTKDDAATPLSSARPNRFTNEGGPSSAETGAVDQSFRMIVRPTLWGDTFRVRFTNFFGTGPVTIDGAYLGLHASSGAVVAGTNRALTFG